MASGTRSGALVVVAAAVLITGAAQAAARPPGAGLLHEPGSAGALRYARTPVGSLAPLRDDYVRGILGGRFGSPLPGRDPAAAAARPGPRVGGDELGVRTAPRRVVLVHPFSNDAFEHPVDVPTLPFTASTDTRAATSQPGEPRSCALVGGTVWYRYRPARDTAVVADTFGSRYATALGVFAGDTLGSLEPVGCGASATGNAQVGFLARAGRSYWFQVAGLAGGGDLVFSLAPVGGTRQVDVSSLGEAANAGSFDPASMTADGGAVAFYSQATNLGPCRDGQCAGIYVREASARRTDTIAWIRRQDVQTGFGGGTYGNGPDLWTPALSADGRFVAFHTDSPGFVDGDTNGDYDVIVYDRARQAYERASLGSDGREGHSPAVDAQRLPVGGSEDNFPGSKLPALSADGRYVAFTSSASDLVVGDANAADDVFVRDRATGTTRLVSIAPDGSQLARADTRWSQSISADGRFVTFKGWTSAPPTPVGHVTPEQTAQIFVRDLRLGRTTLISVTPAGRPGNADSYWSSLSADGSHVVFTSEASDLVPGDTNGAACARSGLDTCGVDFFSYDMTTAALVRVSVDSEGHEQQFVNEAGGQASNYPFQPLASASGDGRFVAFPSLATNLVPGDTNAKEDVFVHDLRTGSTVRVSVSSTGAQGDGDSYGPVLSADGSTVSFQSVATNLVADDTNGAPDTFVHELL